MFGVLSGDIAYQTYENFANLQLMIKGKEIKRTYQTYENFANLQRECCV